MLNFCTLFDSRYLVRGLTMYESLAKACASFHLYVFAFDEEAYRLLQLRKDAYPQLTVISLAAFEDEALLAVKPTRTMAEYCWTCTPSTILYCLRHFNLDHCTYIDADMIFYSDPSALIDEMGDKAVLISGHRYTKAYDQSAYSGIYCVQFMCFKNTGEGMEVLHWWRDRCIEWCYARLEDGKFGDQKYLDDWPTRFKSVHVLQHPGGGVAPWNVQQYSIDPRGNITDKASGRSYPLVFFHYHGLKFYTDHKVSLCGPLYELEKDVKEYLYFPYITLLLAMEAAIKPYNIISNPRGAGDASPSRMRIFLQYFKDIAGQIKKGKTSLFHLKNFNFSLHFHFYHLDQFQ